jgi:Flp pilus assembly pilin Flp
MDLIQTKNENGLRLRDEEGQALVEYALILALVSLVAIGLLSALGTDIVGLLERVTSTLASAV